MKYALNDSIHTSSGFFLLAKLNLNLLNLAEIYGYGSVSVTTSSIYGKEIARKI